MLSNILTLSEGFLLGAGLIVGVGPQNTLIMRLGLRRQHLLLMVILCTLIDVWFISISTLGMGTLLKSRMLIQLLTYAGVGFLLIYGARSFKAALSPAAQHKEDLLTTRKQIILALLAVSLFNPSVYLDTLVLIGSNAIRYQADLRVWFALGAMLASLLWFCSLSYGSAYLAPLLKQPRVLRLIDCLSGIILWLMAFRLLNPVG
jgi:L-lysine exporter family protein LysE/ArgO